MARPWLTGHGKPKTVNDDAQTSLNESRGEWSGSTLRFVSKIRLGPWGENLLLVGLVALFLWRGFVPAWQTLNTDFPNYYLAARLDRQHYPLDRVYDWIWFQRQKDHAQIPQPLISYIPLSLFSALVVEPVSGLPPLVAKRCWLLFNLALLLAVGALLRELTILSRRQIAIIMFLAIVPLRANFLFGQQHLLVLFLLTLAVWLGRRGWAAASGGVLAASAALKIYPGLFLFYYLRKRGWRAVAGLLLVSLVLCLLALKLFGWEAVRVYLWRVIPRALHGESNDPYNVAWNSPTALLRRLFVAEPEWNPHPLWNLPLAYVVLQPLVQALLFVPTLWLIGPQRSATDRERFEWGSYLVFLLILSTNPSSYHFCALILPAALGANYLTISGRPTAARLMILLYGLVCLPFGRFVPQSPGGIRTFLAFPRLYALAALWAFCLWMLREPRQQPSVRPRVAGGPLIFKLLFFALFAVGVVSNWKHFRGQFGNYASRLVTRPGSIMAIAPASTGQEVYFTSMEPAGYVLARADGRTPIDLPRGTDAFFPAVNEVKGKGWVEMAAATSRIVSFPLNGKAMAADRLPIEVDEGERPAVSSDGKWLAFIREVSGRGSLWIKGMGDLAAGAPASGAETMLLSAGWNVLDAAFLPDDRIVAAVRPSGPSRFIEVDRRSSGVLKLDIARESVRYPAASPDGRWMAYSREEGGDWHLWVAKLDGTEQRLLTGGDCNSVTPAWLQDSRTLVYSTDCGRALGQTALCEMVAIP